MSPELRRAATKLEEKAKRSILHPQQRVLDAIREAGAVQAADKLKNLIERDRAVKAEALEEVARVRLSVQK